MLLSLNTPSQRPWAICGSSMAGLTAGQLLVWAEGDQEWMKLVTQMSRSRKIASRGPRARRAARPDVSAARAARSWIRLWLSAAAAAGAGTNSPRRGQGVKNRGLDSQAGLKIVSHF